MHFSTILAFAGSASLAAAAALPVNGTLKTRALAEDDVILYGHNGLHTVMKLADYENVKKRQLSAPPIFGPQNTTVFPQTIKPAPLNLTRRADCEQSEEVQVISTNQFSQWDVPMSSVVVAEAGQATVAVTEGYSIANSLTVSVGFSSSIEGVISTSLGIDYGTTWTTTQTTAYTFTVPVGKSGIVVSNPDTTRYIGKVISGCTDNPTVSDFSTDVYYSEAHGDLSWVKGLIRLCASDTYPVPFCVGTGEHR